MNASSGLSMNLHFTPGLELPWLWGIALCGVALLALSAFYYRRGLFVRGLVFAAFMLALLNPSLLKEERNYVKDVAVIVVDQSSSQKMGERAQRTQTALSSLEKQIGGMEMFDLRVLHAPKNGALANQTDLFSTLDQSLSDVPPKRRAGVVFLTDGQVHDIPKIKDDFEAYGPVHVLLSGRKDEKDRQIVVTHAPAYGLVGQEIVVKYRVEDTGNVNQSHANVTLTLHDGSQRSFYVPVDQEQSLSFSLDHPSQNIFSLAVEPLEDEITVANNKTAIIVNGVRDRLKVLLVSGVPHVGERTWRDLLTSDPGVDLVHFTILREPQKFDYTPKDELSLIAFPFRELFEIKLYDFDLIIFDRYRVNNILPNQYFENIVRYVQEGGAFLEASGPAFAGERSIYRTPLGDILPGIPTGGVSEQRFVPQITEMGQKHPVTRDLIWGDQAKADDDGTQRWGAWLRSIDTTPLRGDVLMNGTEDQPLLLLDRVGEGRVAQISSDHIWLWSRGYDGGGPHAELLRRIVHWLMKEPELDDRALDVVVRDDTIIVRKQNYTEAAEETIALTLPSGEHSTIMLAENGQGILEHQLRAEQLGIYAFEDVNGTRKFAVVGALNPPELRGVKTTAEKFEPIVSASRGTIVWLDDAPQPTVSSSASHKRRFGGSDWISLKRNNDYTVTGVKDIPILPEWAVLLILFSALVFLWWREGRNASG